MMQLVGPMFISIHLINQLIHLHPSIIFVDTNHMFQLHRPNSIPFQPHQHTQVRQYFFLIQV